MFNSTLFHSQNRLTLPKSKGFGRLYNWYAASSRSYGMLYNWYAATDSRNIAPIGWHVPSKIELDTLVTYLGGNSVAGGKLKETGNTYWVNPTEASNDVGFNALGSGFRYAGVGGDFYEERKRTYLISTTTYNSTENYILLLYQGLEASSITTDKKDGNTIRLIKDDSTDTGVMTGNDGKQYATVKIGTQVWMSESLEETKFRNGDTIPVVTDNAAWAALTTAGSCWFENKRTYNLAPVGWHLPNRTEYDTLITYAGGTTVAGGKLKETGTNYWNSPNTGATNELGFSVLGAGFRQVAFGALKQSGLLYLNKDVLNTGYNYTSTMFNNVVSTQYTGLSVRFIRNINSVLTTNPTDSEGNSYETVTIGTQTWTKQNHKSKKLRTGEFINIQDIYTNTEWAALTIPACCAYNNDENNV